MGIASVKTPTGKGELETRDQADPRVSQLEQQLEEEKMTRNYLQLEKDRILEFWDITKTRLAETQAKLRDVTLALERQQFDFMIQLKLHREERRALMEKYHSIETELKLKAAKDAHQCEEEGRRQLLVQESQHQEALHRARMETIEAENTANQCRVRCEEEVSEVRDRLEKELSDARNEFIRKLQDGLQAAEQRCLETVRLTTAQRDIALAEMKDQQQRVLEEIEEKHAATVAAQLQLIKSLKDELHARGYSNKQGRRIEHPLDT